MSPVSVLVVMGGSSVVISRGSSISLWDFSALCVVSIRTHRIRSVRRCILCLFRFFVGVRRLFPPFSLWAAIFRLAFFFFRRISRFEFSNLSCDRFPSFPDLPLYHLLVLRAQLPWLVVLNDFRN